MPAGDLITTDYQIEIRGLLTGAGTSCKLGDEGLSGLGEPEAKTHDTDLGHAAGAYLGRDYPGPRTITVPYLVVASTAAAAGSLLATLITAWQTSETDIPLHLQLPGFGHFAVVGRPRQLLADLSQQKYGLVRAMATFVCGDPTILRAPGAPTIGTATAGPGSGQGTFTWTAPASDGGSAIDGYVYTWYQASTGAVVFQAFDFAPPNTTAPGALASGVPVYAKVRAENAQGLGPYSAASNTVTPP